MVDGFLNLNKAAGMTSHDCVAQVRRLLKMKRVGHGGTLDPAATGVLPIALGKATRLLQYLPSGKAYRATIRFGIKTTTDDLEGETIASEPVEWLTLKDVEAVLPQFQGRIQQIPPSYSAIQVNGRRLYDLARAGEMVDIPIRTVEIYRMDVLEWRSGNFPELVVDISCGAGTYIRAIARDLGDLLRTGGTLAHLLRTSSSGFQLDQSITLEDLADQVSGNGFQAIAPEQPLLHLPKVTLTPQEARRWCQGQRIIDPQGSFLPEPGLWRVHHEQGRFLGIGDLIVASEGHLLAPHLVLEPIH